MFNIGKSLRKPNQSNFLLVSICDFHATPYWGYFSSYLYSPVLFFPFPFLFHSPVSFQNKGKGLGHLEWLWWLWNGHAEAARPIWLNHWPSQPRKSDEYWFCNFYNHLRKQRPKSVLPSPMDVIRKLLQLRTTDLYFCLKLWYENFRSQNKNFNKNRECTSKNLRSLKNKICSHLNCNVLLCLETNSSQVSTLTWSYCFSSLRSILQPQ